MRGFTTYKNSWRAPASSQYNHRIRHDSLVRSVSDTINSRCECRLQTQQSHLNLEKLATGPLRRYKSFLEFYHDMFEHINVVLCAMGSWMLWWDLDLTKRDLEKSHFLQWDLDRAGIKYIILKGISWGQDPVPRTSDATSAKILGSNTHVGQQCASCSAIVSKQNYE